jgi:Protein of unknown function (DUF4232)
MARAAIAGAALTCVAALAAACGSASPSAAPATTAEASPAASAATSAASTPASSPTPAASPQVAGAAACPTRSLAAKVGVSQGTAGSVYTVIDFTNIGTATCTLYGYPGVSLAGGTPVTQIGQAATESKATARALVTLQPGAVANALLQVVDAGNYPPATCGLTNATDLQIYPPNQTTPIYLGFKTQACTSKSVHILTISVVMPGSGSAG